MWIFFAGLFYIVVVIVYSKYNIAKKKDETPMFAVFKGIINSLIYVIVEHSRSVNLKYFVRF